MVLNESLIIFCIKYAAPSWCGFTNDEHIKQLRSLPNKLIRLNYFPSNYPKIKSIFASLGERLFSKVTNNPQYVLHRILPPVKSTSRDMRRRTHNCTKTLLLPRHSFLVFSILNKFILLIVHRFKIEPSFFPFVVSSMLTFMTDNILFSYILMFSFLV